ncbi:MAG TPA: iron-containing alcohol dehydrogenase [Nitrolancea sp.]|nr:iron-containing alcohol dehydrogenase [Nitrolancea sp.]
MNDAASGAYTFRLPTEVRFGEGIAFGLGDAVRELGARRVLIVTDPGVRQVGIVDRLIQTLAAPEVAIEIFDAVSPNPRDVECVAGAQRARVFGANLVVGIGGGSPLDAAKAIAGLATNEGPPGAWEAPRAFSNPPLPVIAVPTTAGTGAEVSWSAVITDTDRHLKMTVRDVQLAPRIALVDPELTYSTPRALTAAVGMDTLTHAVEAYTCRLANPISDALALQAIRLVAANLLRVVQDGNDRPARAAMMQASLLAGMAFRNADVGAVHCLAEAIGGRYDTPHGVANAVFLAGVFAHNVPANPERHAAVAEALGVEPSDHGALRTAGNGAEALRRLAHAAGIPPLSELPGVDPADFPLIAEAAVHNLSNQSNARPLTVEEYERLLRHAWAD